MIHNSFSLSHFKRFFSHSNDSLLIAFINVHVYLNHFYLKDRQISRIFNLIIVSTVGSGEDSNRRGGKLFK